MSFRKENLPVGYTENHHILPRSMGGSDDESNLVKLTGREHWIAHLLLWKIHKNSQCLQACHMMAMRCEERGIPQIRNSRMYELVRSHHAKIASVRGKTFIGSKNSQFGTQWVCDPKNKINRKIPSRDQIPIGWVKGRNIWNKKKKLSSEQLARSKSEGAKKRWKLHPQMPDSAKRKMSLSKLGNKSLSGRIWITDGKVNQVIEKDSEIPSGWDRGKTLRRHDEEVSYGSSKADS